MAGRAESRGTALVALLAALAGALLWLAAIAPSAEADRGSLPTVKSGPLPGPPILYRKPSTPPQLQHSAPFAAQPLLVSGSDGYRRGEYLYQDYLFDDYGANTVPGRGSHTPGADDVASQTDGDIFYPTADRYANNAADIVELRIKRTNRAVHYRTTLNTMKSEDAALIGIGIDTDRSGGPQVSWPAGAGVGTRGLDGFITASAGGATVYERNGSGWQTRRLAAGNVEVDELRNQITVRVGRKAGLHPGADETWRYVAGAGLDDGSGKFLQVPARAAPTDSEPASGSSTEDAPAIFNLAFRWREPQKSLRVAPYDSFPAAGVWFEAEQARRLAAGRTGNFYADVDFGVLASGARGAPHPPGRTQARILPSRLRLGEGVQPGTFPKYRGRLQPYLISIPSGYDPDGKRVGLTFTLHSLGGNYNQYKTYSPNQIRQFGEQRDNIVVSPLARGTDGWYRDEAEFDVFEVWADVAHRYRLNPRRTYPTGYSMGGMGTYKLGVEYPDLWARAFTTVGPPGEGVWVPPAPPSGGVETNTNPLLENVRWIPYMNWAEVNDELVPYEGVRAQFDRFNRLKLRNRLYSFTPGEHFTLALLDEWGPARDWLGQGRTRLNPSRVDYAFLPAADRPKLGLRHDSAYWVSGVRARNAPNAGTRGEIRARSLAYGQRNQRTRRINPSTLPGLNGLNAIEGTGWTKLTRAPKRNVLQVNAENVRRARIEGGRARLTARRRLRIVVRSDGPGTLRVTAPGTRGASVRRGPAKLGARGAVISYGAGKTSVVLTP